MFKQFLIKEWKEKFPFFILAILLFIGLVVIALSGRKERAGIVASSLLMVILPLIGVMIGSSSFAAEFKNEAWTYLFSRPLKKWIVWLIKYFAQLTVLIVIFLIFLLLLKLLPGVNAIIQTFSIRWGKSDISLFSLSLLASILAFTIAFSISILSEKQLIIFLVTALIVFGQGLLFQKYFDLLFQISPQIQLHSTSLKGILVFLALSFAAASLLTFVKSDFSQQLKKTWLFTKFVVVFLVISVVISTAWTMGVFRSEKRDSISNIEITSDAAYFGTEKGVFRFDPFQNKLKKIERTGSALFIEQLSASGDKLAILKVKLKKEGKAERLVPELWVMNKDGSGKKNLFEDYRKKDSPFVDQFLWPCLISPDGERIAFVTKDWKNNKVTLWSLNSDGTGLRSQPLDLPEIDWVNLVGWEMPGKSIIISTLSKRGTPKSNCELLNFDLETGGYEILAKNLRKPYGAQISPGRDSAAFVYYDERDSKEVLARVDLRSIEKEEIYRGNAIDGFCFNGVGDKIAFIADKEKLGIYSSSDKKLETIKEFKPEKKLWNEKERWSFYYLSWVSGGKKLVFGDYIRGEPCLRVFGDDLKQEKIIKMPFFPEQAHIRALKNIVFVTSMMTKELWVVDIDTEKWHKIY